MAYSSGVRDSGDKKRPPLAQTLAKLKGYSESYNIAEELEDEHLEKIGMEVEREYQIDKKSRSDWEASCEKAMNVALQVRQPKNYPFQNAANIKYPLVTVAALQFGARAYPAIVDGNRIVKAQVLGADPQGLKKQRAERVSAHMSYQLLHEMEEWEEDTDVLLHHLPIVGCAFRKVWRSEELRRNRSEMIPAVHLVVNNKVRSLDDAPRVTHELFLYPQGIDERMRTGTFIECELPRSADGETGDDDDAPHMFLEQHRYLDLDEDGYREPYIVTVHKDTCKVVRIVANYTTSDIEHDNKKIQRIQKDQYFVKYSFIPDPKGGFYDIGFGKLLESLSETIDTTINQMLDAGHLQNAGGGFIGSGVRLKKGTIALSPGKYTSVEASAGDLKNSIYNFEHPGPSAVLFNLLGLMVDAARDITAVKDILTGDSGDKVQTATTTLALIEQGLKVFTAIYKRIYRALRDEFALLFKLNSHYLEQEQYFNFLDEEMAISKDDYDIKALDIVPVADPKMVTDMQRMSRAQVVLQTMGIVPNKAEALKYVYETIGLDKELVEKLVPEQQGPSPVEQLMVEEKMAQIEGIKAKTMETAAKADKMNAEAEAVGPQQDNSEIEFGKLMIEQEDKAERRMMDRDKTANELLLAAERQRADDQFRRDQARVDLALKKEKQDGDLAIKEMAAKAAVKAKPKVRADA